MSRLVHAGSAVVDYVYRIDALPSPGTEKVAASYDRVAGGGFNMMVAASRTGMQVVFAGQHGTGPNGDFLRAAFAAEKIETLTPSAPTLDTGNCVVLVTGDAERTFVSWPGAEGVFERDGARAGRRRAGRLGVHLWLYAELSRQPRRPGRLDRGAAGKQSLRVRSDAGGVRNPEKILARVLARTTWLSCNAAEAAAIAGTTDIATNADLLMGRHCPRAAGLVIRSGEAGAFIRLRDGASTTIPGFTVAAVDTNGAGDTHIGAFVSALSRGEQPFEAARYANAAAAISVTRHGGSSAPSDAEIHDFLAATAGRSGTTDQDRKKITA